MSAVITLLAAAILTDNIVLSKLLGVTEATTEQAGLFPLLKKCGLLTALMLVTTAAFYPLDRFVLSPLGIEYLSALVAIIIICGILALIFILSKRFLPAVYGFISRNSALLYCSAAVLGVCLSSVTYDKITNYPLALLYAVGAGLGLTLVSIIFYGINYRMATADLPDTVKGLPISLIIAALLSLAFGGFAGI